MDLEAIAPIIEDIIRQSLYLKEYKFGVKVPPQKGGTDNKIASGTLARSVEVKVTHQNNINELNILIAEYGQWVQSGRLSGKGFVPVGSLLKWIKQRGLKGRDKKGKFIKDISFAFAIQKNIRKFGIKPANYLDISFEKIYEDPRILELIGEDSFEELVDSINIIFK